MYFLAEPVRRYEKLFTVDVSSFSVNVPDKEDLSNDRTKLGKLSRKMTIADKISHFATMVQQEDEAWEVDAVIYTGGQVATAIKFTDPGQIEAMGVAKVWNESGIDLYVLSAPAFQPEGKEKMGL